MILRRRCKDTSHSCIMQAGKFRVMSQKRSAFDWALEAVSSAVLLLLIGAVWWHWAELPARIPTHFGASGHPDGWGDKSRLLLLPLTAIGIYIVLTLCSRYPQLINIPMPVNRDLPEVQRLLQSMMILLKAVLLLTFFYLVLANMRTAVGHAAGLGVEFLPLSLAATAITLGVYLRKLRPYRN